MENKKSLFKNTIYKSILSFVNILIPLLVGPYIVKLLDVNLYGAYNKAYADFQLFLTFASFGVYTYGIKEISKIRNDKEKVSKLLTNLFVISLISNIVVGGIYVGYSFIIAKDITRTLYLLMLIQIIANIFYVEFVNEALENYKFITLKTLLIKIFYMASLFLFVKKPSDIIIYSIIICLTVFANNLVSFIYASKRIKFNFKTLELKKYLKPLFLIVIITNIDLLYSQLDMVLLGKFIDGVAVTMYYIPFYIVSTLVAVPYSIIFVSIPRLSYLIDNEGKESYENTLNKAVSSLLFIIIPMCLGVFVLAKEIVYLYAGDKYMAIVPVLMAAAIIRIFISIDSTLINLVMYPNNQEKKIVKYTLIAGIINLIFNLVMGFTKTLTPLTCMISTGIVQLILGVLLYIQVKYKMQINYKLFTKQNILYMILSLLFIPISMLIRCFNLNFYINILLIMIACMGIYGIVLLILKDENVNLILRKLRRK
mgnify:FL=1